MNRQALKEFAPVLVLLIVLAYSFIVAAATDVVLILPHYIAFALASVAAIAFFFHRTVYLVVLGITLIAGTFDLLSFTPTTYTITFIIVRVQPFSFVILIAFCIIFRNEILGLLENLSSEL